MSIGVFNVKEFPHHAFDALSFSITTTYTFLIVDLEIPSSSSSSTQISPLLYSRLRPTAKMATSRRILITSENTGLWQAEQDEETAAKVTELLQQDFEV